LRRQRTHNTTGYPGFEPPHPRGGPDESARRTRIDDGVPTEALMAQLVQILASLLILAAFGASQRGALSQSSRVYLTLNLAGSAVLAVLAAHERQLGFLVLEASWAVVSALSLVKSREPGR
jgi:hypothetical protein